MINSIAAHHYGPAGNGSARDRARRDGIMTAIPLCADDSCILRDDGAGSAFIAQFLLHAMAGDDVARNTVDSRPAFIPKDQCLDCALSVMGDGKPIMNVEAYRKSVKAAHRSHGRWRRQRRQDGRWM